jgi:hypothetical protein
MRTHSTARSRVAPPNPGADEVHEFIVFKFKSGVSEDQQVSTMRDLDTFLKCLPGFRTREYFYSATDKRWVDHIVWADRAAALASRRVTEHPIAADLFALFNQSSIVFSRYQRIAPK